jgi:type I restriction enzyme M protein
LDLCGYPHEEEEILPPLELIAQYQEKRLKLNQEIDGILEKVTKILELPVI